MRLYLLTNGSVFTILLDLRLIIAVRSFDAGITTLQNHPYVEHLLAVGRLVSASIPEPVVYCSSIVMIPQLAYLICENLSCHYQKLTLAVELGE